MKIVIELINAFLHVYICTLFYRAFWDRKANKIVYYSSIVLTTAVLTLSLIYFKETPFMYGIILLINLSIAFLFNCRLTSKIIFSLIYFAVGSISEVVVAILINTIFSVNFADGKHGAPYITGMLISKFVLVIIVILIKAKKHSPLLKQYQKSYFSIFLFPLSTLLIGIAQHHIFLTNPNQSNGTMIFILICYSLLITANLIVFDFIDSIYTNTYNESKLDTANQIIITQTNQYKELIEHNKDIAKIQHDNKHLFLGLIDEIEKGNYSSAVEILKEKCNVYDENIISGENIFLTIVKIKSEEAKKNDIDLIYNVKSIPQISIEPTDLAILLGNALDNAIEATCEIKGTDTRTIELIVSIKNDMLFITVINPVKRNVDIDNLESQKTDSRLHGFGIINMKTIAKKYNGEIVFSCEEKEFKTTIFLKNS